MYKIEFLEAKNHEQTVKINDIMLHSLYSPSNEAQKFVQNIQVDFNFKNIFIIEPGLGYSINFIKERFPETNIYVIKFLKEISLINKNINIINYYDFSSPLDFENYFYNKFTEIELLSSFFISWHVSEKIFPSVNNEIWKSIKNVLDRSKSVLITRGYFEKKWLKNCCNNLKYLKYVTEIKNKINLPVLITASGPSLKNLIPFIQRNQNKFFIICVSSAINPLIINNIIPDLCITTDGGYWAGEHLEILKKNKIDTVLALPLEGYCQKEVLSLNKILPLSYGDGISYELEKNTDISFLKAERNGTVSGTALKLALTLTDREIFFCGLDLHNTKGFQHLKPNKIENQKILNSNKINSIQKNTLGSELNSGSLKTYENWFQMQPNFKNNIFRIIDSPRNSLNHIPDINCNKFIQLTENISEINKKNIFTEVKQISKNQKQAYLKKTLNYINENYNSDDWIQNEFPLDSVSLIHCKDNEEKNKIIEKINNKNRKLIDNLNSILKFSDL